MYHHGLGVSAERVLQQTGQFGVPVRDVCAFAVHQGRDDVAQGGQGQVDLGGFLQTLACSARLPLPLRTLGGGGGGGSEMEKH